MEVEAYLARFRDERDEAAHALVVRNRAALPCCFGARAASSPPPRLGATPRGATSTAPHPQQSPDGPRRRTRFRFLEDAPVVAVYVRRRGAWSLQCRPKERSLVGPHLYPGADNSACFPQGFRVFGPPCVAADSAMKLGASTRLGPAGGDHISDEVGADQKGTSTLRAPQRGCSAIRRHRQVAVAFVTP